MAFRTRRQQRYLKLREQFGFLPFEARPLSKVPATVPYMREFMRDRQKMKKKAITERVSQAEYERRVKSLYQGNRWLRKDKLGRIVADPWRALRDYHDKWMEKQPTYESPWQRRWKDWRAYVSKTEAGLKRRGYLQQ